MLKLEINVSAVNRLLEARKEVQERADPERGRLTPARQPVSTGAGRIAGSAPGNHQDIAQGVLFALTNTFLTGQTPPIDGGEPLT
jgi:hypothetical protein